MIFISLTKILTKDDPKTFLINVDDISLIQRNGNLTVLTNKTNKLRLSVKETPEQIHEKIRHECWVLFGSELNRIAEVLMRLR